VGPAGEDKYNNAAVATPGARIVQIKAKKVERAGRGVESQQPTARKIKGGHGEGKSGVDAARSARLPPILIASTLGR